MLHNELIREFPCDGELVPVAELSSDWWTVTWCAKCGTEIKHLACSSQEDQGFCVTAAPVCSIPRRSCAQTRSLAVRPRVGARL